MERPLTAALAAHLPAGALEGCDPVALEAVLAERLAAARRDVPGVQLSDEQFLGWLSRHLPVVDLDTLSGLYVEDLFLCCACLQGDRAAQAVLDRRILSQVPRWVGRLAQSPEDVQQELRAALLFGEGGGRLRDYAGRGSLERWIKVAATRRAISQQRSQKPVDPLDEVEELFSGPDPQLDFVKLRDREALRKVLQEAIRGLPARELGLLRLHYLQSVSLDKLAALERVHRATVARWLAEARARVLARARALLHERLRLTEAESDSLVRFVGSRLDLSLRTVFGAGKE
jgi:RNA polymerase sigma-70 factor (ECF subfamily)